MAVLVASLLLAAQDAVSFDEKRLATIPEGVFVHPPPVFAADGRSVAYAAGASGRQFVTRGDIKGDDYEAVSLPGFSADGKRLVYFAGDGDHWFVVIDGKAGPKYDDVEAPVFSDDGQAVAYRAKRGLKWLVVVNDKEGEEFDRVAGPSFIPGTRDVAFVGRKDGKSVVVVGAATLGPYGWADNPVFSPDGKRMAFAVNEGGKVTAYGMRGWEGGKWRIVVDDSNGGAFNFIDRPVFSPDGTTLAYTAARGPLVVLVVNGESRDLWTSKSFPPDLSTPTVGAGGKVALAVKKDGKWAVDVNGSCGRAFDQICGISISPMGDRVAYGAMKDGRNVVVIDGKVEEGGAWNAPVFSPDGKSIAFLVETAGKKGAIKVGGTTGPECDDLCDPVFSADGKKVAYGARIGQELWWKVLDVK